MTPYEALGGEAGVRALVEDFYWRMQDQDEYRHLRALHPQDMDNARERLFKYFSGWTGGPQLFVQAYGHPMLRARHLHVAIDLRGRDQWLACMRQALEANVSDATIRQQLWEALVPLADHMRNVAEV
jgi:hemoglobin